MERDLWEKERGALGAAGVLWRVENGIQAGTPDVAYCLKIEVGGLVTVQGSGWIENKYECWPKRDGFLNLTELTLEQVMFAEAWERAGGRCWLLTRWDDGMHTLNRSMITRHLHMRDLTRESLLSNATLTWRGPRWPVGRILRALCL